MSDPGPKRVVVCRAGTERFAVPITLVREIVALPPLTRIPGAPPAVWGLANVHGILVTVLVGSRQAPRQADGAGDWLVVLTSRRGQIGIAADEVEDLSTAADSTALALDVDGLIRSVMGG